MWLALWLGCPIPTTFDGEVTLDGAPLSFEACSNTDAGIQLRTTDGGGLYVQDDAMLWYAPGIVCTDATWPYAGTCDPPVVEIDACVGVDGDWVRYFGNPVEKWTGTVTFDCVGAAAVSGALEVRACSDTWVD